MNDRSGEGLEIVCAKYRLPLVLVGFFVVGTCVIVFWLIARQIHAAIFEQQVVSGTIMLVTVTVGSLAVSAAAFLALSIWAQYSTTISDTGLHRSTWFSSIFIPWSEVKHVGFGANYVKLTSATRAMRIVLPLYRNPPKLLQYMDEQLRSQGGLRGLSGA
jgi:hypothetical protein